MPPHATTDLRRVAILVDSTTTWSRTLIRGILDYTRVHGSWHVHLEPQPRDGRLHLPDGWRGDGIIARVANESICAELEATALPVVNISGVRLKTNPFPRVITQADALGRLAFHTFRDRGFRRFAYVGDLSLAYVRDHLAAYRAAVTGAGHGLSVHDISTTASLAGFLSGLPKPVAAFCWGPSLGHRVIDTCQLSGLAVPHDVAVLGSAWDDLLSEASHPAQAAIRVQSERIGATAASVLDGMMRGHPPEQQEWHLEPHGVVEKPSIDTLAVDDPVLADVMEHLKTHALGPLSIDDLVRHVPVGRRSLERNFRRAFGCSILEHLRRTRINHARTLLAETRTPIAEVSRRCGFSSCTYFNRIFKQVTGTAPGRYRRQWRATAPGRGLIPAAPIDARPTG